MKEKKCKVCGKKLKGKQKSFCSNKCKIKNLKKCKKGKTLLNKELISNITKIIQAGSYINTACRAVGISKETYYEWLKKGDQEKDSIYSIFYDAVKKAEAEAEVSLLLTIRKKANDDWRAAETILKKRFRERWGDNLKLDHEGGIKVKLNVGDKVRRILRNPELTNIINDIIKEQGGEGFFEEGSGNTEPEISGDVCE